MTQQLLDSMKVLLHTDCNGEGFLVDYIGDHLKVMQTVNCL